MSPLRVALKNASAIAMPRSLGTSNLGRSARTWVRARAASWRQAAGVAIDSLGDFLEGDAEDVVQEERRAFEGRQTFEREHEREGDAIEVFFRRFDDRLREPRPDIGFAAMARGLELIQAQARHDAAQERLRFADGFAVSGEPPEEGLLNDVLGVRDRPEHAIRNADQPRTQRSERGRRVGILRGIHSFYFRSGGFAFGYGMDGAKADLEPIPAVDHNDERREDDNFLIGEMRPQAGIHVVGGVRLGEQSQRLRPCQSGAFAAGIERRFAPGVQQVEAFFGLALLAGLRGVHVEAERARVELGGSNLYELHQCSFEAGGLDMLAEVDEFLGQRGNGGERIQSGGHRHGLFSFCIDDEMQLARVTCRRN